MVPHLRVPGDIQTDAPNPVKTDPRILSRVKSASTNTKWMSYAAFAQCQMTCYPSPRIMIGKKQKQERKHMNIMTSKLNDEKGQIEV